ncbi:OVARIAN TUMOR DOMAIN-containing deubiquitinating enzyme 4 isoform X2 [Phoenix dactylifera]|nr:OVARIAN TUMOR DOMAIN-containing deubiquitinating enzyme 4 isoform X2 [Phoenix dactylifera]
MATIVSLMGRQLRLGLVAKRRSMSLRLSLPARDKFSRISWNARHFSWKAGGTSVGLCLIFSTSGPAHAEASRGKIDESNECSSPSFNTSHGKKVYTDYSITGIPGDGRCLFRSVAHGACIRSGKPLPDEDLQRELADELRARVADEFVKRRAETEWFIEGDFNSYVSQIRMPHVWGGEPELFMASHVLQMPITVYMLDDDAGGLIAIAEYGQEYGKEDPIRVLYYGFGHYDALQMPGKKGPKSRL